MGAALKITRETMQLLASEWEIRQGVYSKLRDERFPKQVSYIDDKARLSASLCTRRAGKTGGNGRLMLLDAIRHPKSPILYLLTTRDECKYVMWEPVIKPLNDEFGLGGVANETELSMKFPNGSYIRCFGVDAKPDEMKKVLGVGYRLVIIDEAQKFRVDLRKLVFEMLLPAMADLQGRIRLSGTPDDLTSGLFYSVTRQEGQREPGWSVHEWNTFENPYMVKQWTSDIAMLKETQPRIEETPSFQRMYLGKWVVDTSALVYKFDPSRNLVSALPDANWTYVLGIDLGYSPDPSAFVVCAYNLRQQSLYVVETYRKTEMIISAVAERVRYYQTKYNPSHMVIDGAAKQSVEEMRQRFELPLISAEKTGKSDFIEIMNSDLIQGRIKLVDIETKELQEEWKSLIWDQMSSRREEHPNCANHLCFVAGTMIQTKDCAIPIESLEVGDFVETRNGLRRVSHTMHSVADTIRLELSNGNVIKTTPEHPFWSDGRWVKAKNLTANHPLLSWREAKERREPNSTGLSIAAIMTLATLVAKTSNLFRSAYNFIESCGHTLTAPYHQSTTFTTKTGIQAITTSQILSAFQVKLTDWSTSRLLLKERAAKRIWTYSNRFAPSQSRGTSQKREENGISNMAKRRLALLTQTVLVAMLHTRNLICRRTKTAAVLLNVSQLNAARLASTIFPKLAQLAQRAIARIDIVDHRHVPVHVLSITGTTEETVYNLTVAGEHEYFANGILVSNCDAMLYAWRHCYQYLFKPDAGPKLSEHTHFIPENMLTTTAGSSIAKAFTFRG